MMMRSALRTRRVSSLVGSSILSTSQRWCSTDSKKPQQQNQPPLSATEFNALQNHNVLTEAFNLKTSSGSINDAQGQRLVVYRLKSCPFCAKVTALLDYHGVQYSIVDVDPLNGEGLPSFKYDLVPQIQVVEKAKAAEFGLHKQKSGSVLSVGFKEGDGPIFVDSAEITKLIAKPLGFEKELESAEVVEARKWVTEAFTRLIFVSLNSSWMSSYNAYPSFVSAKYNFLFARMIGATALSILTKWKIEPKLRNSVKFEEKDTVLDVLKRESSVAFNEKYLDGGKRPFHGGSTPDLADIDLYGVLRSTEGHEKVTKIIDDTKLGEWWKRMDEVVVSRGGQTRG